MRLNFEGTPRSGMKIVGDLTRNLLTELRGQMSFLKICRFTLQSLSKSRFIGLGLNIGIIELTIETAFHNEELEGLLVLLRGCPYLKRLTIIIAEKNVCTAYLPPLDEISCVLNLSCINYLEEASVHGYKGSKRDDGFLKYLIHKGKNMQELLISSHSKRVHHTRAHRLQDVKKLSPYLHITVK